MHDKLPDQDSLPNTRLWQEPWLKEARIRGGHRYQRQKAYAQAIEVYDQMLQVDATSVIVSLHKYLCILALGQKADELLQQTWQLAQAWARRRPEHAYAHLRLGEVLFVLDQEGEALESFNQAVRLAPDNAEMYVALAHALFVWQGSDVISLLDQALLINPKDAFAYYLKGCELQEMLCHQEALDCFEQAISLKPENTAYRKAKEHVLCYLQ